MHIPPLSPNASAGIMSGKNIATMAETGGKLHLANFSADGLAMLQTTSEHVFRIDAATKGW